ncbi:MAG: NAD(P)/FAD-dependent oxidoreductase [bacterium]|nr:NAD(P)/FAD-dependent oxidoreductase [bacterium]
MKFYDVVIVGASFSGLTLAHHLPQNFNVLVVDIKPEPGSSVESTGLITEKTRKEFASFFAIDRYLTNPISAICVVAPNYDDYFVSQVEKPWIYQTDTKALVRALAQMVPPNVQVQSQTVFTGVESTGDFLTVRIQKKGEPAEVIQTRFLVGADGGHSKVAASVPELDQNKRFLFGYEQVFFGEVSLGPRPEETIYHFWFGEFSLGYGGWLSPTIVDGKKAFRVGLAKLAADRGQAKNLMTQFLEILQKRGIIRIEGEINQPGYVFGSMIPMGGALRIIFHKNILLIGDAAGFCGAFAADGIKGSVISGKEAAPLIANYLDGDLSAPGKLHVRMNVHGNVMQYYAKQLRYRWVWDQMKRNRTFRAMYDIIAAECDSFLEQFCDSKDSRKSLARTILKWRHVPKLVRYVMFLLADMLSK